MNARLHLVCHVRGNLWEFSPSRSLSPSQSRASSVTESSGGTHGKRAADTSGHTLRDRRRVSASGRAAPQYEAELQKISKSPYLNSEDLLEEIKLKKMKLHCKDEMERIAARIIRARASYSQ